MQGTILYPLNKLKDTIPLAYKYHNIKYEGRREMQDTEIPGLGRWGDVIHLTPIDPVETKAAMQAAGVWKGWQWRVFKIDPTSLDQSKLVIMTKKPEDEKLVPTYEKFSIVALKKVSHLSPWTLNYYKECKAKDIDPLTYAGSPHVFYGAPIETKRIDVVEYS